MAPNGQTDANLKVITDNYDPPVLTGVTKLKLPFANRLIQQSLATNTFNNLDRHVDPKFGDVYIYKCGKAHLVSARDGQNWKHDGVYPRRHYLVPNREFSQAAYIKEDNKDDKKYVLSDPLNGVHVVHYRHKVNVEKVKLGKSSQNKTSIVEKIKVLKSSKDKTPIVAKIKVWKSSQNKTSKDDKIKVPKSSQNKTSNKVLDKDLKEDKPIAKPTTRKATSPHRKERPAKRLCLRPDDNSEESDASKRQDRTQSPVVVKDDAQLQTQPEEDCSKDPTTEVHRSEDEVALQEIYDLIFAPGLVNVEDFYPLGSDQRIENGDPQQAFEASSTPKPSPPKTDANLKVITDNYDPPVLTGVTKLKLPFANRLIQQSLATNTFNNLDRHVDPKFGDVYIYKCGKAHLVSARDGQNWKHDGVYPRRHYLVPNREFSQAAYIKEDNKDDKKYVLSDPLNGVHVVHYRHKVNVEKVKLGKSSQNKTSNTEKIKFPESSQASQNTTSHNGLDKDLIEDIKTIETNFIASFHRVTSWFESSQELEDQRLEIQDYMTKELNYAEKINNLLDTKYSSGWQPETNTVKTYEAKECLAQLHASHSRYLQFRGARERTEEQLQMLFELGQKEWVDILRGMELLSNCEKIGWYRMEMDENIENLLQRIQEWQVPE